jgi:rhamnosyltransferase
VIGNILSYSCFVTKTFVLDNSEKPCKHIKEEIAKLGDVSYISTGENKGIAKALNEAILMAKRENLSYLLTMDQDSCFEKHMIKNYLNCINDWSEKANTAMFGVQFVDANSVKNGCVAEKKEKLITSGSVININAIDDVSGFDEKLFIDEVDNEFCYRCIMKGYKIIQFTNIYLNHNLGTTSIHKSFKNLAETPRRLHTPIRLYYMTRNFFYVYSKYRHHFPTSLKESKHDLLTNIKNNLLYNKAKLQVLKYIVKGIVDFKQQRMGKY